MIKFCLSKGWINYFLNYPYPLQIFGCFFVFAGDKSTSISWLQQSIRITAKDMSNTYNIVLQSTSPDSYHSHILLITLNSHISTSVFARVCIFKTIFFTFCCTCLKLFCFGGNIDKNQKRKTPNRSSNICVITFTFMSATKYNSDTT